MKRALDWLFSNRNLAVLLLGLKAYAFGLASTLPGRGWTMALVALAVAAIIGLCLWKTWAQKLAAALLAASAVFSLYVMSNNGFSTRRLFGAIASAYIAWGVWKRPKEGFFDAGDGDASHPSSDGDDKPLISLVHLRSSQRYLEPAILAQALSDAWSIKLEAKADPEDEASDESDGFVAGGDAVYFVFTFKPAMAMFMVHNREDQYFNEVEDLARKVPNLRFANIIREHSAWLAIDLMENATVPQMRDQAYQMIGKAITALADDDTLALFCPQHQYFNLWSEELENVLCGPNPLGAFKKEVKAPVIGVKNSTTMEEAIAEAKRRWPEFVAAFKERDPNDPRFIVKAAFTTGEDTEHMWLEVFGIEPEYVHGHLMNEPFHHPTLKQGSQVEVPVSDISDWLFPKGDEPVGNFTGHLVNAAAKPQAG
ncbi:uncharacterized protein YegJ (DUF2314 family) [Roseimicrobium gellanilyticum]|uniref:Uncharacterized protein YegJ (DUF2314 family) n=1 Tax=Roseimicrobium gellanilyticum TaxID=748857 RepID=A0A366HLD3_9BACT|nr:DUF2314 domain-containing protein [Roseimicrobium gellanilyticum]RBP43748.1 uncharacterized protein YegJ (DUF2314 family) [Roseimicrobium gellanilyticum]